MINYQKDDFDGNLDDIMQSINEILNKTGDGFETKEDEEEDEGKENKKIK